MHHLFEVYSMSIFLFSPSFVGVNIRWFYFEHGLQFQDTSATDIASPWNPSRQVREDARSQVTWRSRSNEKRNPDSSNIDSRSRNGWFWI